MGAKANKHKAAGDTYQRHQRIDAANKQYEMACKVIAKLFPPETPVVLHSMSAAKHNGLVGRCGRYDGVKGRCSVTLADTARKVSVKPDNLRLLYPPGTRVELHSLASSSALNGRAGRCGRFDPVKGRYVVVLDGEWTRVSVKPGNLRRT